MENIRPYYHFIHDMNYLRIPKTGSTAISEQGDGVRLYKPKYNKPTFTVLRDPYERAMSAYHECLRRRTFAGEPKEYFERIINLGFFDEHQLPMTWYINNAPMTVGTIFKDVEAYERNFDIKLKYLNFTKEKMAYKPFKTYIERIYSADIILFDELSKKDKMLP